MLHVMNAIKASLFGKKAAPQVERRRRSKDRRTPSVGEYVVYRHLKLRVTQTKNDELWKWLVHAGWRVPATDNDRRRYVVLPETTYAKLDLASSSDRPMLVRAMLRQKQSA